MSHTQYKGKVAASGNSGALRLEAGFFKAYTQFATGSILVAEPIGDEVVVIRALTNGQDVGDEPDPVMDAFLSFIEAEMINDPSSIEPFPEDELEEARRLVEGVGFD